MKYTFSSYYMDETEFTGDQSMMEIAFCAQSAAFRCFKPTAKAHENEQNFLRYPA